MTDYVSPARTRVLLALIAVYERDGRATVRTVAEEAGLSSSNTAHWHLVALRGLGLVHWSHGAAGTLRPAVAVVRTGVRPGARMAENRSGPGAAPTARDPADTLKGRGRHARR